MFRALLFVALLGVAGFARGAEISWDVETALAEKADAGDMAAATELAGRLLTGANGGNPDARSAVSWLKKAASAHHLPAQVMLGDLYFYGYAVARDYPKALGLYRPAADAGDLYAIVQMGVLYSRCGCDFHNPIRGLDLFRRAAAQHYPPAYYNLGLSYQHGIGTPPDRVKAARWYERGAARGDSRSMSLLAALYETGYGGVEKLPEKAFALYQRAALLGDPDGFFGLGKAYAQGLGTSPDRTLAREWLLKAAQVGHGEAQEALGFSYLETAKDVAGDFDRAVSWLEAAGANGVGKAYTFLAQHFEMKMDFERAYDYAELASHSSDPDTAAVARSLMESIGSKAEYAGSPT